MAKSQRESRGDRIANAIDRAAEDEPVRHIRGIRNVILALAAEDFPMSREQVDYALGDLEVEDGHGGFVPIRLLTDRLGQEEFRSAEEVVKALRSA